MEKGKNTPEKSTAAWKRRLILTGAAMLVLAAGVSALLPALKGSWSLAAFASTLQYASIFLLAAAAMFMAGARPVQPPTITNVLKNNWFSTAALAAGLICLGLGALLALLA